jgi:hypothetical protein
MGNSWIGYDWILAYFPTIWRWVSGGDPYAVNPSGLYFMNPPWLLPIIAPFGLLPPTIGAIAMGVLFATGVVAVCARYKRPWVALLIIASMPVLVGIADGQVDGIVLWGLALGGPFGFLLLSVKPQVASLVAIVWVMKEYKKGGWKAVAKLVGPTAVIAIASTIMYPQWVSSMMSANNQMGAIRINLWPYLIPVGVGLLLLALRNRHEVFASFATNLLVPYLRVQSYSGTLALAAEYPWLCAVFAVGSWLFLFMR